MPVPNTTHRNELHPLNWFKPDERELARHDDPEKIRLLANDMLAKGQLQAVGAKEDGSIIFGHGRWLAATLAKLEKLEAKIFPASLSDTQIKLIRVAENLQRKDLTNYQKSEQAAELMALNPDWTQKTLAEQINMSEAMVVKLLSPSKCTPAWREALRTGMVGISDIYSASMLSPDDQNTLLAMRLSGVNREGLERQSKKMRKGAVNEVRARRIRLQLASGVEIVVSGPEMTLDEMIDSLVEASKQAKKARDQGLDAKTFESVMRDRARAGA